MPDHLHALIAITADTSLSNTVVNFKRATGKIFWRQVAAQFFSSSSAKR
jgi:REP element-mobilizing transposase RayT